VGDTPEPPIDPAATAEPQAWFVYVLRSSRARRTYVGISTDPSRRLEQHNGDRPGGAKSTRAHRPWQIGIVYGPFEGRSAASQCEAAVKRRRADARLVAPYPVVDGT
jgi:predicted GIY-YIG superfamily endonuclease